MWEVRQQLQGKGASIGGTRNVKELRKPQPIYFPVIFHFVNEEEQCMLKIILHLSKSKKDASISIK